MDAAANKINGENQTCDTEVLDAAEACESEILVVRFEAQIQEPLRRRRCNRSSGGLLIDS